MGPSYPLWEKVYPVCSGPLLPLARGGLPSLQWALRPSWERRFTQCAAGPSSLLREEVYPVCNGPFLPLERGGLYLVYSGPFIPLERGGLYLLHTVQWALHPSWERRFNQCAIGPSFLLRAEVYPVCSGPLIPPERGGLPSVQWALPPSWERRLIPSVQWALPPSWERRLILSVQRALYRSWERRFTQCTVSPSSLLREEVYLVCSGPFISLERGGLPSV